MSKAQFERAKVIQSATRLFWQSGYHAASMKQLFEATGLKPGSLYLAFGNKDALYKTALSHYTQSSIATLSATIESAPSVGEGICKILLSMTKDTKNSDYCSCFLVKSQLELSGTQNNLLAYVQEQLRAIENTYCNYLAKEMSPSSAKTKASCLMMSIFGLRVYGYIEQDSKKILTTLKQNLAWLPWDKL